MKRWTIEEDNIIKEKFYNYTAKKISIDYLSQRSEGAILIRARRLKVVKIPQKQKSIPWNIKEIELLKDVYGKMSARANLHLFPNRSYIAIKNKARKIGLIADRSLSGCYLFYNKSFFHKPNINNSYIAGYIAGDGCISNNKVSIISKDLEQLKNIKQEVNFDGLIYKDRRYFCLTLCGANEWIINLRNNFNIIQKKSLILKHPDGLDLECSLAFIIGLIDSDGSLLIDKNNKKELHMVGTQSVLLWVKNIFVNYLKSDSKANVIPKENIFYYKIVGRKAEYIIKKLFEINLSFRLNRKWDKFIYLLNEVKVKEI